MLFSNSMNGRLWFTQSNFFKKGRQGMNQITKGRAAPEQRGGEHQRCCAVAPLGRHRRLVRRRGHGHLFMFAPDDVPRQARLLFRAAENKQKQKQKQAR